MKKGKISIYILIILFLLVIISGDKRVLISNAEQVTGVELPQGVSQVESGVVKLLVYAVDQEGNQYNVKQGTGILIGTADGQEMVLTNDKLIRADEELLNKIRRQFGLSMESDLNIETDIVLQVGTRIQTEEGSAGEDFVILNLVADISNISCVKLGNSSKVKENDKLFILEYGGNSDILGAEQVGNLSLQPSSVQVTAVTEEEIVTDYALEGVNMGAPVMNADGYVVGILVQGAEGLFIKPIDKIKSVLDVLNISYQRAEADNHYNEVTDEIRVELNKILLECEELAMQKDIYTEKSIGALKAVIKEAIEITANTEATYDDYQNTIEQLNKYKGKLRKKEYPIRMLQIGLGVAILIFSVLGVQTKMQIKKLKAESGAGIEKNVVVYAKLIRLDTMQEIPITNVIFRIGQNMGDIDYAVENNTSVSRHHADIMRKGNEFFVLDNNSTNHTYVNEKQAMPGEYVSIKGGDIIRLSDVRFRFEV